MLTSEMPLSASTACNAWMASVLVSGVCVFKMICASGKLPAQQRPVHQFGIDLQHLAQIHAFKINRARRNHFFRLCAGRRRRALAPARGGAGRRTAAAAGGTRLA